MAKYTLLNDGTYKNNETNQTGIRPGVYLFKDVQKWLDEGNIPEPEFTQEELDNNQWKKIRNERNNLLRKTDFMMLQDYFNSIAVEQQIDIKNYRKDLRDLPENTIDPYNCVWPIKPQIVIDNNI